MQSDMDEASPSSPDPLNDSLIFNAPPSTKRRKTPHSRLSLPTPGSSPRKQIFELDVGDALSPQKIRVTVQAGDSDEEDDHANLRPHNFSSPTPAPLGRRIERTTTTTVPLRGLSDTEDNTQFGATPKRGRGRPRKSDTPLKRPPTPIRGRKRGRKSISNELGDEDLDAGDEIETEKSNKKPRSKSIKSTPKKSTPSRKKADPANSSVVKRGRGRPKSKLREEVRLSEERIEVEEPQLPDGRNRAASHENLKDLMQEELDLLETIDAEPSSSASIAFPGAQSTSPVPSSEEDIVIARFHPGEETPRVTGWSNSRLMDEPNPSSPINAQGETSAYNESLKNAALFSESDVVEDNNGDYDHGRSDSDDMDEHSDELYTEGVFDETNDANQDEYSEDEMDDDVGHMPEFDTIMESEGFSLISIDSVPSLRKPLSGLLPEQVQDSTSRPKNKSILSVQGLVASRQDDSFSSIAPEILEAATPGAKARNRHLLRVQNARVDDSFSSIPPDILEAATPAQKANDPAPRSTYSSEAGDDGPSMPTNKKSQSPSPTPAAIKGNPIYEDSFSAIPPGILEAATPRPMRQAPIRASSILESGPRTQVTKRNSSSLGQGVPLSKSTKSPSPPVKDVEPSYPATAKVTLSRPSVSQIVENEAEEASVNSQINSSPPPIASRGYTYTARLRQQRQLNPDMTQTPPILFSSPSLPPPILPPRQPSERPESAATNAPSPAEKAGRVLQDIVIPSSLPRSRSQSLASPFKSPATERRSSSSIYPDSNNIRPQISEQPKTSLPRLDHSGDLAPQQLRKRSRSRSVHDDDSFSANVAMQTRLSGDRNQSSNMDLINTRQMSKSGDSTVSPQEAPRYEPTNWQSNLGVKSSISKEAPPSSPTKDGKRQSDEKNNFWDEKWAAERAAVSKQISTASTSQVVVLGSDNDDDNDDLGDDSSDGSNNDDDDDDGYEDDAADKELEAQIHVESEAYDSGEDILDQDDEDFGLLLETLNSSQQEDQLKSDNSERPRRSKIPSPWRTKSGRLIYSDEHSPVLNSKVSPAEEPSPKTITPVKTREVSQPEPKSDDTESIDLSGWQIPQKANFRPILRAVSVEKPDLSALLRSPPLEGLPGVRNRSHTNSEKQVSNEVVDAMKTKSSSASTSDENLQGRSQPFVVIPQKMDFQPRVRKATETTQKASVHQPTQVSRGIFGKFGAGGGVKTNLPTPDSSLSSMVGPLTDTSPNRSNTLNQPPLPSDISNHPPHASSAHTSNKVDTKENRPVDKDSLKWIKHIRLEAPNAAPPASPTKSILRSPARPSFANNAHPSPSKNVVFASSSPQPSSPITPQLSPTVWTRDHWILLESILQTWKPENSSNGNGDANGGGKYGRRNSTRVISRLLGKVITLRNTGDGEKMRLEQWHLEAVDEFRGEVPGWDEKVVAKRVFALLVGEERRKKGLIKD